MIKRVSSFKLLGVWHQNNLKWNTHIEKIAKKAIKRLLCLRSTDHTRIVNFQRQQLVVPSSLRNDLMKVAHARHIGIEGCQRRVRETLYWPRMNTEFKEYMSKCDVCMAHRRAQQKEPLLQHDIPARPWPKLPLIYAPSTVENCW